MNGASLWRWLAEKDTGGLAFAALILAVALPTSTAVKLWFEARKLRAEAAKIEAEARRADRQEAASERERVQACARNILQSVSATVDEVRATFGPFADPPDDISDGKLKETTRVARRFSHEQRYRIESERHLAELRALVRGTEDEALARLQARMLDLLAKISDKKLHVANIEADGLTKENAATVAAWLKELLEIQIAIASLVGEISGRLSLADHRAVKRIDCAA